MDRVKAAATARQLAWDARAQASTAAAAGHLTDAEVWHDVAAAADDLADMIANLHTHLAAHA